MSLQTIRCVAVAYSDEEDDGGGGVRASVFVARDSGVIEKYTSARKAVRAMTATAVVLRGHTRAVTALCAVSPDELHSCALDGTLRHWNTEVRPEEGVDVGGGATRSQHGGNDAAASSRLLGVVTLPTPLHCLARRHDGRLCAGGHDGRLFIVDGARQSAWDGHSDVVSCVSYSRGGRAVVSGSYDQQLRVWDSETGRCVRVLSGHTNVVRGVAVVAAPAASSLRLLHGGAHGNSNDDDDDNDGGDEDGGDGGRGYRAGGTASGAAALPRRLRAAHAVSDVDGVREVVVSFAADATARVWALPTLRDDGGDGGGGDDDDDAELEEMMAALEGGRSGA